MGKVTKSKSKLGEAAGGVHKRHVHFKQHKGARPRTRGGAQSRGRTSAVKPLTGKALREFAAVSYTGRTQEEETAYRQAQDQRALPGTREPPSFSPLLFLPPLRGGASLTVLTGCRIL